MKITEINIRISDVLDTDFITTKSVMTEEMVDRYNAKFIPIIKELQAELKGLNK